MDRPPRTRDGPPNPRLTGLWHLGFWGFQERHKYPQWHCPQATPPPPVSGLILLVTSAQSPFDFTGHLIPPPPPPHHLGTCELSPAGSRQASVCASVCVTSCLGSWQTTKATTACDSPRQKSGFVCRASARVRHGCLSFPCAMCHPSPGLGNPDSTRSHIGMQRQPCPPTPCNAQADMLFQREVPGGNKHGAPDPFSANWAHPCQYTTPNTGVWFVRSNPRTITVMQTVRQLLRGRCVICWPQGLGPGLNSRESHTQYQSTSSENKWTVRPCNDVDGACMCSAVQRDRQRCSPVP